MLYGVTLYLVAIHTPPHLLKLVWAISSPQMLFTTSCWRLTLQPADMEMYVIVWVILWPSGRKSRGFKVIKIFPGLYWDVLTCPVGWFGRDLCLSWWEWRGTLPFHQIENCHCDKNKTLHLYSVMVNKYTWKHICTAYLALNHTSWRIVLFCFLISCI